MHGKQLVKQFAMDPEELDRLTGEAMGVATIGDLESAMTSTVNDVSPNQIVKGTVLSVLQDGIVVVDDGRRHRLLEITNFGQCHGLRSEPLELLGVHRVLLD